MRRLIVESISVQTFRTRGRILIRLIGETLEIATATKTIRGRIKRVNEILNVGGA